MRELTSEEMQEIKTELRNTLKEAMYILGRVTTDLYEQTKYTKQLSQQNATLLGYLKFKNLEEDYSDFSKDYTEWKNRQKF